MLSLKLQRMRDMCDAEGKNAILRHTQRLRNVLHVVRCAKYAPQRSKLMKIPWGYQKKVFIV